MGLLRSEASKRTIIMREARKQTKLLERLADPERFRREAEARAARVAQIRSDAATGKHRTSALVCSVFLASIMLLVLITTLLGV